SPLKLRFRLFPSYVIAALATVSRASSEMTTKRAALWLWFSLLAVLLGHPPGSQAGPVTDQLKGDLTRVFRVIEETGAIEGARAIDVEARRSAIRTAAEPAFDWRESG